MVRRSHLRASDADREYVAERLRNAAGEGRLLAEELEHRLGTAFSARTYGELDAVVADLPRDRAVGLARGRTPVRLHPVVLVALAILFPFALAAVAAALIATVAVLTAWAAIVVLAALFLGPRGRALRGPWAMGCRTGRRVRRVDRSAVGGFTPWL
jgi:hypothetical protein